MKIVVVMPGRKPFVNEILRGTFCVCGAPEDSNRFVSLTEEQIEHYLEAFARPEIFLSLGGRTIILPCREREVFDDES